LLLLTLTDYYCLTCCVMDGISHVRALLGRTSYDIGVAPHIPNNK
jgi:hypothetical protein